MIFILTPAFETLTQYVEIISTCWDINFKCWDFKSTRKENKLLSHNWYLSLNLLWSQIFLLSIQHLITRPQKTNSVPDLLSRLKCSGESVIVSTCFSSRPICLAGEFSLINGFIASSCERETTGKVPCLSSACKIAFLTSVLAFKTF